MKARKRVCELRVLLFMRISQELKVGSEAHHTRIEKRSDGLARVIEVWIDSLKRGLNLQLFAPARVSFLFATCASLLQAQPTFAMIRNI
eukprot:scaffold2736_cov82-Skeletonema_dohrnii-CCMP3373.AAC.7